jgi:hypothetical protein
VCIVKIKISLRTQHGMMQLLLVLSANLTTIVRNKKQGQTHDVNVNRYEGVRQLYVGVGKTGL